MTVAGIQLEQCPGFECFVRNCFQVNSLDIFVVRFSTRAPGPLQAEDIKGVNLTAKRLLGNAPLCYYKSSTQAM